MNINNLTRIFLIGIGGIGMSVLARFFKQRGASVSGYDRTPTPLTRSLEAEGITIHFSDDITMLDEQAELVIYTPAVPATHAMLLWYQERNYPVYKRSDVLQWITEALYSVTIAGTHGKTTISSMTGVILRESGFGCNAFLGGIAANYQSNYWSSDRQLAVIEADEYDRSFLKLRPDLAVLTSMDPDHLDIYGTEEAMVSAFAEYASNIKSDGTLIVRHGLAGAAHFKAPNKLTYSLQNDAADAFASNIMQKDGGYVFDFSSPYGALTDAHLQIGGMHNVENAVAAITVALKLGVAPDAVSAALAAYIGVKRRFEYIIRTERLVYIDDYAHHPAELEALISSARRLFPALRCVVAFQPHLFSRTRDLASGFAASLSLADEVILLDIYPARELPIEGITSATIADLITDTPCTRLSREGLLAFVAALPPCLFITAGAGDIDALVLPIKLILDEKI
jgi:UDP-N-acetylmuramate--alanine ligase